MQNIDELRADVKKQVDKIIDTYTEVLPEDLGLDRRSAYRLYVDEDEEYIACHNNDRRTLDYYGGFEYVDPSCIFTLGNYTFYLCNDDRVAGHLKTFLEEEEE